jgi:hypothetical protein
VADPPRKRALGVSIPPEPDSDAEEDDAVADRIAWQNLAREYQAPPVRRRPVVVSEPAPASGRTPKQQQWATLIAAVVTALVGGGAGVGISEVARPKPHDPAPQLDEIRSELKRARDDIREIRDHLRRAGTGDQERWDITQGLLCRINGSKTVPYARGVECDAVLWEPPPLGAVGPWKARADWPRTERAP